MRYADWPQRLDQAIRDAQKKTFSWGTWDCCLFAADVVLAITGVDPAENLRGTYSDEAGAAAIIASYGSLELLARSLLGEPIHPSRAMRGDLVIAEIQIADGSRADAIGVCIGVQCAFAQGRGLKFIKTKEVRCVWGIA